MRIVRDFETCPAACQNAVVALGNFDGMHLGHQAILAECLRRARDGGIPAAVMTFEPHPREFFARRIPPPAGGGNHLRLYPLRRKLELMRELGIDIVFLARFNVRFAALSAAQFVETVLHRQLAVRHVITGYNFAFGKNREGSTEFLEAASRTAGFGFTACPPVSTEGQPVSSSAIRALLAAGEIRQASLLLGRAYAIEGRVKHGEARGRALGFATANLPLDALCKPRFGVYAIRASVDGQWHAGVANIGTRPTFGLHTPILEAHLFDASLTLYGKRLRVELVEFIREEKRFDGPEALKAQIAADCDQARRILEHVHG